MFAETIRFGQARGDMPSELGASSVGQVLVDAYFGVVIRWAAADDSVSLKTQLSAVLELISRALRPN